MSKSAIRIPSKVIGITMGDPAGIGPEVIAKAVKSFKNFPPSTRYLLIGDRRVYQKYFKHFPAGVSVCDIPVQGPCPLGKISRAGGQASLRCLEQAVTFLKNGIIDSLVTGPVSKESVALFHKGFVGHTEYLAEAFGVQNFDMMFDAPGLRTVIVTRHVPLSSVPRMITKQTVFNSIVLAAHGLKKHFKVRSPKIAVLGLNPHAGEAGAMGKEDKEQIIPAIRQANQKGISTKGPFPADTFFAHGARDYDCVIAMYHDQGLIPVKTLHFKEVVNFTLGLPFVRTSPAHGTAFDIAGKNKADASSMIHAIDLACRLT